ncbi:hypothetical protein K1T71_000567 [Dendrolimus kikuchii]|uniref:Uncharacterized protein n=1 Tax=Dendrolimus kikuchii TaxID=765133 RepID=A0ACC1DJJ5_9NEOP|nr:hypothetical protein K1T71_000567 [Dendrolimus kikuchii]
MDGLCTTCLCKGRKLFTLEATGLYELFSQILNEISISDVKKECTHICWECFAKAKNWKKFRNQAQNSYKLLMGHTQQAAHTLISYTTLTTHHIKHISYPDNAIKPENFFTDDEIKSELMIKSEEETEHCEPETFVNEINMRIPKKKEKEETSKKLKKKLKGHKFKTTRKKKTLTDKSHKRSPSPVDDIDDCENGLNDAIDNKDDMNDLEEYTAGHDEMDNKKDERCAKIPPKSKKKMKVEKSNTTRKKKSLKEDTVKSNLASVDDCYNGLDAMLDGKVNSKDVENHHDDLVNDEKQETKEILPEDNKDIYKQVFANKSVLGEKPQCVECGKMFSSKKTFRYHWNVLHKGQNRYPCPICGKVYQWKSNLGRHLRSHKARDSGELYCELCDKRFASVATYKQHLRVSRRHVTESEFSFMCNECGKKFVSKTRLRDHIDWEHLKKIKFRCQLCHKQTIFYHNNQHNHRRKEKPAPRKTVHSGTWNDYFALRLRNAFGTYSELKRTVQFRPQVPKKTGKNSITSTELVSASLAPLLGLELFGPSPKLSKQTFVGRLFHLCAQWTTV